MKYRIGAPRMGPVLITVPFEVYTDTADPIKDEPLATMPMVVRDSDTLDSAVTRMLDHMTMLEALYHHNLKEADARKRRFAIIQERVAPFVGAVVTSAQLRQLALDEDFL